MFQNTVGSPRLRHSVSRSLISVLGPDVPVSLNFQLPEFPFHADSMNMKSSPSNWDFQLVRKSWVSDHSYPKLSIEKSSRMTPTFRSSNIGEFCGFGNAGNMSVSLVPERSFLRSAAGESAAP
ncbi:MAG: hypothetical protein ACTIDO_14690 [Brevibacterium aurantiacum]